MPDEVPANCSRCLMGLYGTSFAAAPGAHLCHECAELEAHPYDVDLFPAELRRVLDASEGRHVLAYSGGMDSTAALKLLVEEYGIHPHLVHVDNGFRPQAVWDNIFAIRDHYGLELEILRRSIVELIRREFPAGTLFCGEDCSERWFKPAMREVCERGGFPVCLTGNEAVRANTIVRPGAPPLVSVLAARPMTKGQRGDYIADLPWRDPRIYGYDTDCIYAGWALTEYWAIHGKWPPLVISHLSRRIRLGLCDRGLELDQLRAGPQAPPEQISLTRQLLGL
ncbi:MAG: phosphoadenosine phosphosulfate reductase family protein [Acidobacteria bacterium]|nr:phosphoadenosine phosphosulfate reductase family protein [Acidobacteriota bacterium]